MGVLRLRANHASPDLGWLLAGMAGSLALAVTFAVSAYVVGPMLFPLAAVALGFVVLAFLFPWIGVAAAMLAIPMELVALPLPTGSLSPAEGALAVTGAAYLARLVARPETVSKPSVRDLPFLGLLGAVAIGLAFATEPAPIWRTLILWSLWYAVFLQIQTFDLGQIKLAVAGLVIGGGILGAIGAFQFAQAGDAVLYGGGVNERVSGTFGEDQGTSNYYASALQLAVLPAIALLVAAPRRNVWMLPLAAALIVGLLFSLSRGGTLGFVAGLLLLVLLWGRARIAIVAIAVVLVGLTVAGANPLVGSERVDTVSQRLATITEFQETSSTNLRPRAYSEAIAITSENPVFGVGINQFQSEVATRGRLSERGQPLENVHNLFLGLGAETGLVGLGAFGFFVAMLFGRARAALRSRDPQAKALALGLAAALFGFAVQGLTVSQNRNPLLWGTFLVVAGLLVTLGDRAEAEDALLAAEPLPEAEPPAAWPELEGRRPG